MGARSRHGRARGREENGGKDEKNSSFSEKLYFIENREEREKQEKIRQETQFLEQEVQFRKNKKELDEIIEEHANNRSNSIAARAARDLIESK